MPKPRPLTPAEASRSLANRFAPKVDRLRQFATRFGIRPYRVFLTWTTFSGGEHGAGKETVVHRIEVLPTPVVESLDSISRSAFSAGMFPVGSVRVSKVSATLSDDLLRGRANEVLDGEQIRADVTFFYEVVEDGRAREGDTVRRRFRLASDPMRKAASLEWVFVLERMSEDMGRDGEPEDD